jgi:hypothetical protein
MSTFDPGEKVDEGQLTLAKRLAKQVLDCDPSVLSMLVLDKQGKVLAVERSTRLPEEEKVDEEVIPKLGVVAKLIIGAANNAVEYMGRMQYLIGGFKHQTVLLINLQEYNMVLALRLARSASAEYVYNKIAHMLGTIT